MTTETTVPITLPLPSGVSVSWSSIGAQCVVWCSHCQTGHAIYTTVLVKDGLVLQQTIDEHLCCQSPDLVTR